MAPPGDSAMAEVLAVLSDGVLVFDDEGRLSMANAAFRRLSPTLDAFLTPGTPWSMLLREAERQAGFPEDLCSRLRRMEAELLEGIGGADNVVEAVLPGDRACRFRLDALANGGFLLVQALAEGHSEEVDAAREAEALLRKVLEASPVSLTMSRIGDGHVIYRSPAATELLGTAKSSFSHFARRSERADFITALLPDGRVDDMRVTGLRGDGSEFPARLSARLIDYGGEDVVVSSIEDLTEELAIEAELARNRDQLFQAEKMSAMGELLAGVAHELNNPLSIIIGNTGILREDLEGTSHVERLDRLSTAAERCIGIVRSFLSMARGRPLTVDPVGFSEVADSAIEATASLAAAAAVVVDVESEADLPPFGADRVQMAQVLINLVTNAIHAIQDSGTGANVSLRAARGRPGTAAITVADDGPGIDEAIRGRIFDPLFTTKAPGKGTGVGLAFCMRVVTAHRGTLILEPTSGRGAVFTLELPLADG
jgi:PAS domain S-box-containing protein